MTVFSKSTASRQDNDTAFPTMIEWATATNRAIAPMEFPDALHYLLKDQKMTVEHLEEPSLIPTRTIIRLSNDPDYGVTREHICGVIGWTDTPVDHQYRTVAESGTGDEEHHTPQYIQHDPMRDVFLQD